MPRILYLSDSMVACSSSSTSDRAYEDRSREAGRVNRHEHRRNNSDCEGGFGLPSAHLENLWQVIWK